ncbi:MAG TPA: S-methyl-5'-thioinosine phosphorylase [Burkholderiales bacterium]
MIGIIGGSGLSELEGVEGARRRAVRTPYGRPSGALVLGTLRGRKVVFLQRHGPGHAIPPHEVNYRANIWALHAQKARNVVAIAAVGGIRRDLGPGAFAVPDQIIDYTHGRASTFYTRGRGPVTHIDFTRPYCEAMRQRLLRAARAAGVAVAAEGTYAATQGPRLETAAEIGRLERDGAHLVGMTGMPEAALARELGLCYAALAIVVNHAAGRGAAEREIRPAELRVVAERATGRVRAILEQLVMLDGD